MIGLVRGLLLEKSPPTVIVLAGGVGYEVDVPMSTLYDLPDTGREVQLYCHFVVREDAQQLYGFLTRAERDAFRQLLKVSGVGPKLALAVLSNLSVGDLAAVLSTGDAARLAKTPGIGKKTAERLILELGGKLAPAGTRLPGTLTPPATPQSDVLQALLALGYSEKEAGSVVKQLPEDVKVEDGIRQALKQLAKA